MQLIYLTHTLKNDAGVDTPVRVFISLYDEVTGNLTSVNDLLFDQSKLSNLVYSGFKFNYLKTNDLVNPLFVVGEELPASVNALRIDSIYALINSALNGAAQLPAEMAERVTSVITKQTGSEKTAKLIVICCYAFNRLLRQDLNVIGNFSAINIAPGFERQTQDWLNEINRKNTMASIPDNETKFQPTCTSELFIKLPAYDAMFNYLSKEEDDTEQQVLRDLHGFMPTRAEVSDPYGSNAAQYEDPDRVESMMNDSSQVYQNILKEIIGSDGNNTAEIHENEKRYYDSLCEWMGIIATDSDGQDTGDLCAISLEYLHTLVETLYIWYWQHNKRVPCNVIVSHTSSDSDGLVYDESKYEFKTEDHNGVATEDLIQFLDRVSADLGREVYAKAIVQLARWGNRKPTKIVFDGYDKCFNLNIGIPESAMPTLSSYTPIKTNGCDYGFSGFVIDTSTISDPHIGFKQWPMPVGIAVTQTFQSKDDGEQIVVESYYSMIDAIKEIVQGNITIDGVSYSSGAGWTFTATKCNEVTINQVIGASKRPDNLQFPIFRGTGLIQIYSDLRINSPEIPDSHFSIMDTQLKTSKILSLIDESTFDDYAGLDALTKDGKLFRKQVTNRMILRDLLKVYHFVATNWNADSDAATVFTAWHNAILETGYVDEAYFYKGVTKQSVPLPGCKVENFSKCFWHTGDAYRETVAATTSNVAQSATDTPKRMTFTDDGGNKAMADFNSAIIMQPAPNCGYCKFVTESGETICVCAVNHRTKKDAAGNEKPDPVFIILDSNTVTASNIPSGIRTYSESRLGAYVMKAFFTMARNMPVTSNLRFINIAAIKEMYNYYKQKG